MERLQDHILGRLLGQEYDGDEAEFTNEARKQIYLAKYLLYRHKALRINFTTYDVRRSQDSLNPNTDHCDIMVHAREDPTSRHLHPFWYARVIDLFHVNVNRARSDGTLQVAERMDVLWVRWFGKDHTFHAGPKACRLDRIGFVTDEDDTEPFGFLDPTHVVRACHLIPAFAHGQTSDTLGPSIARHDPTTSEDWRYYYVNR